MSSQRGLQVSALAAGAALLVIVFGCGQNSSPRSSGATSSGKGGGPAVAPAAADVVAPPSADEASREGAKEPQAPASGGGSHAAGQVTGVPGSPSATVSIDGKQQVAIPVVNVRATCPAIPHYCGASPDRATGMTEGLHLPCARETFGRERVAVGRPRHSYIFHARA